MCNTRPRQTTSNLLTKSEPGTNCNTNTRKPSMSNSDRCRLTRQRELTEKPSNRTFVQHNYHDHMMDPLQVHTDSSAMDGLDKVGPRGPRGGVTVAFPEKLHKMLAITDAADFSGVVSWQPHGRCFLIHRKRDFVEHIMPRFFHQTKLTSFQRQLNLYGFIRLTAGRDRGGYYHEMFLQGRSDLANQIVRTRIKGNGMKAASSPSTEPNLYGMDFCDGTTAYVSGTMKDSTVTLDGADASEVKYGMQDIAEPIKTETSVRFPDWATEICTGLIEPLPKLISPPSSPHQASKAFDAVSSDLFEMSSVDSVSNLLSYPFGSTRTSEEFPSLTSFDANLASIEESWVVADEPHSGDEVFFEGEKFRYLDHVDFEEVLGDFIRDAKSVAFV